MFDELVRAQCGIVSGEQALRNGVTRGRVRAHIAAGRWARVFPGIYATFSGPLPRAAQLWAAVLQAGTGAMLSHHTAAEVAGLIERPSSTIHVTVPHQRNPCRVSGVRIHRSCRAAKARHPAKNPPQTRIEETVIDLTQYSRTLDEAVSWIARAVGARITTAERLEGAMDARPKVRWRAALIAAVRDVGLGCHSLLELAYLRNVERAHALPSGERQTARPRRGGNRRDDVFYREYRLRVELDGDVAHPVHQRSRDNRADNDAVLAGHQPLRYGSAAIFDTPCS